MMRKALLWLPFALVIGLFFVFWVSLKNPSERVIASKVVHQPLPVFNAKAAFPDRPGVTDAQFKDGKPRLLNIFASWCVPCVQEVPVLLELQRAGVEIQGVAVHDTVTDLAQFLAENGDPYARIGLDEGGRAQMAFGSSGVPETFVIDGKGRILYQHIGIVRREDVPKLIAMLGSQR